MYAFRHEMYLILFSTQISEPRLKVAAEDWGLVIGGKRLSYFCCIRQFMESLAAKC
jgi:hypothetical protein